MKLISKIDISNFRSIHKATLASPGDLTALAGPNNSGKSNVLRALNAFFTGETDLGAPLTVDYDHYRGPLLPKGKKRTIRVSVSFDLPASFSFRKSIGPVQEFLGGRRFEITKTWTRAQTAPLYGLNGTPVEGLENRDMIERFLSLISFRYIPNRVLPLDIIKAEHRALRDVLIRRLAGRSRGLESPLEALKETSAALITRLTDHVRESCPGVGDVKLATPSSWQDLVFAFGYRLASGGVEVDDAAQGSGIQSLLMLETLSLIDRDYSRMFGWKQATIWAVEEPESSLHSSLEARVGNYLADIATDASGRLQIFTTTHSDIVLQYADRAAFITQDSGATKLRAPEDKRSVIEESSRAGISRWTHPILAYPLDPLVLVEGKFDHAIIERAIRLLAPRSRIRVRYLDDMTGGDLTGGVDELKSYLKYHARAIRTRLREAPILVLLDWDSASRKKEFEKYVPAEHGAVLVWPPSTFNPRLHKSFRGIERHLSDRLIDKAGEDTGLLMPRRDGTLAVSPDEYDRFKGAVFQVVENGLLKSDLTFAEAFLREVIDASKRMAAGVTAPVQAQRAAAGTG
jgi:energy-coupling factor transporter ATP-binding protein EcfA2